MNRKISVSVLVLMAVVMLSAPLVMAMPGEDKNSEKFLSLEINKVSGPPVGPVVVINHPAPPAETQFRRAIVPEGLAYAEIIINGGTPYTLGVDFTYESTLIVDSHLNSDPVVANLIVEQTYVFLPASGVTGNLDIQTVGKLWPNGQDGLSYTYSWGHSVGHGTGDLEGVQLKATGWHTGPGTIHHEGYVTNWPVP